MEKGDLQHLKFVRLQPAPTHFFGRRKPIDTIKTVCIDLDDLELAIGKIAKVKSGTIRCIAQHIEEGTKEAMTPEPKQKTDFPKPRKRLLQITQHKEISGQPLQLVKESKPKFLHMQRPKG